MTCKRAIGLVVIAAICLSFSYKGFTDAQAVENAIGSTLRSHKVLHSLGPSGLFKALTCGLAGLMLVGAVLAIIDAKEKTFMLILVLLLWSWLVEGLLSTEWSIPVLMSVMKNTSMIGTVLLT